MATQCVAGIGGVHDHATLAQNFHGLVDQPLLRVFRVNLEKLTHESAPCSSLAAMEASPFEPPMQFGESGVAWPLACHSSGVNRCSDNACTEPASSSRSEEHTSELQSRPHLVCR